MVGYQWIGFCILMLLLPATMASSNSNQFKIIGGEKVVNGEYPWVTALLYADVSSGFNAQFCGGSLMAPNMVITAAHCVAGLDVDDIDVAVGINDLDSITATDRIQVVGIHVHPDFDYSTMDNDIALLRLSRNSISKPLALLSLDEAEALPVGQLLTTMGWGALDNLHNESLWVEPDFPTELQHVQIPLVDNVSCQDSMTSPYSVVTDNMLCAGYVAGGKSSCQGDSGGPLIYDDGVNRYQVGIESWGEECALPDLPGVYTKLANYFDWVEVNKNFTFPSYYNFGVIGEDYAPTKTIEVKNVGDTTYTVYEIKLVNGEYFQQTNNCAVINPEETCSIELAYNPGGNGLHEDDVSIVFNDTSNIRIPVMGESAAYVDAEYLYGTYMDWYSGADNRWSGYKLGDRTVMQSGSVWDAGRTVILSHVTGPGVLTFDWKVSSEEYYDYLLFVVDDAVYDGISGETSWKSKSYNLDGGEHVIQWWYVKDFSSSEGMDSGWIDNVNWSGRTSLNVKSSNTPVASALKGGGGGVNILWLCLLLLVHRKNKCSERIV